MPLRPDEKGEVLEISPVSVTDFALALLKSNGHNVSKVLHVYSALNGWWPGYDLILYKSYGATERTAYVWYERGRLRINTVIGWFDEANAPPEKTGPPGTEKQIAAFDEAEEKL